MTAGLRERQCCPDWCEGDDHVKSVDVTPADNPHHWRLIAQAPSWLVTVHKPVNGPGWPTIVVEHYDSDANIREEVLLSAAEARMIAAWLTKAADEVNFRG